MRRGGVEGPKLFPFLGRGKVGEEGGPGRLSTGIRFGRKPSPKSGFGLPIRSVAERSLHNFSSTPTLKSSSGARERSCTMRKVVIS